MMGEVFFEKHPSLPYLTFKVRYALDGSKRSFTLGELMVMAVSFRTRE